MRTQDLGHLDIKEQQVDIFVAECIARLYGVYTGATRWREGMAAIWRVTTSGRRLVIDGETGDYFI